MVHFIVGFTGDDVLLLLQNESTPLLLLVIHVGFFENLLPLAFVLWGLLGGVGLALLWYWLLFDGFIVHFVIFSLLVRTIVLNVRSGIRRGRWNERFGLLAILLVLLGLGKFGPSRRRSLSTWTRRVGWTRKRARGLRMHESG